MSASEGDEFDMEEEFEEEDGEFDEEGEEGEQIVDGADTAVGLVAASCTVSLQILEILAV